MTDRSGITAALATMLLVVPIAASADVACNDLLTESVQLTADLNCPGTNGIRAGADGITIDAIRSPATPPSTASR